MVEEVQVPAEYSCGKRVTSVTLCRYQSWYWFHERLGFKIDVVVVHIPKVFLYVLPALFFDSDGMIVILCLRVN